MNDTAIITVITGLPRSGTSLMMQLIEKMGIEPIADGIRESDSNNPEGYYEYEPVKSIVKDNSFLKNCKGKAIKIVTPLPIFLDKSLNYRILFMRREMEEILMSQEKMLNKDQRSERDKFNSIYTQHLAKSYQFFEAHNIPYLDVNYSQLIHDMENEVSKILKFLELNLDTAIFGNVIKPHLYRNIK